MIKRFTKRFPFIFIACLGPLLGLKAQGAWELKKDKDSIYIYTRSAEGCKFNELKVVFCIRGSFEQLRAIIEDVNHYREWAYATKTSKLVEKRSADEMVYYSEVVAPWPLSNRDFYSDTRIWLDTASHLLRISSHSMVNNYPEKNHLVRVPYLKAEWVVRSLAPGNMQVEYTLGWNPGGSIPAWIANLFSTSGPYETFSQLRKKLAGMNPS